MWFLPWGIYKLKKGGVITPELMDLDLAVQP
jgi:hypothetical protein